MQTFDDMPRRLYFGVSVLLEVNRLVRLLGPWLFKTLNINLAFAFCRCSSSVCQPNLSRTFF